jgi:hypothetical protein
MTCFEKLQPMVPQSNKTPEMPSYPVKPVGRWNEHYCKYTTGNLQAAYADMEAAFEGGLVKYGGDLTLAVKQAIKAQKNGSNGNGHNTLFEGADGLEEVVQNN